jgi:hypothetical protein
MALSGIQNCFARQADFLSSILIKGCLIFTLIAFFHHQFHGQSLVKLKIAGFITNHYEWRGNMKKIDAVCNIDLRT